MRKDSKIYVAGHNGMVGSAILRRLIDDGYNNLVYKSSAELDLRNQRALQDFMSTEEPEYVFVAAAKVGGIHANNTYRADFLYENMAIQNNLIHSSWLYEVKKLLFLGSSCIYPRSAPQPLNESYLLTGPLEQTNEPYAIAKITGIKMCDAYRYQYGCDFISLMPTNLYGPKDNYDLANSHVLPALMRKFLQAQRNGISEVEVWGTGSPLREFMYSDDLADACLFAMENYSDYGFLNVGTGTDISIADLAALIADIVGFQGNIVFNTTKPDGTPRKLLDVSKIHQLGWRHKVELNEGLKMIYESLQNRAWAD